MNTALFQPQARRYWQLAFFALFLLAPVLDLFRLDLEQGHFWFLRMRWTLGLHEMMQADGWQLSLQVLTRALLPVVGFIVLVLWLVWRYGRIYCGWLCPHYSVVESINALMRRASGKPGLWERKPLPETQSDGTRIHPDRRWWWLVALAILFFSLLWAVTLLTYLLPPQRVWTHLLQLQTSRNEMLFISVAGLLFTLEFTLARHFFCRYACAVGVFQSLVWMGNPRALVVGYDRSHAAQCADCDASCDHACPMRIHPRQGKRIKFTCTQCQSCVLACQRAQSGRGRPVLLKMVSGDCAEPEARYGLGHWPKTDTDCFREQD